MKVEIRCDNCGNTFLGEDFLMDKLGEVLCGDCYLVSQ